MTKLDALLKQHSSVREHAMDEAAIHAHLALLPAWSLADGHVQRVFQFRNYYQSIAFVNALAFLCHSEDHHPELVVNYRSVLVKYQTHSADQGRGGISENDFICAAKADALYEQNAQRVDHGAGHG